MYIRLAKEEDFPRLVNLRVAQQTEDLDKNCDTEEFRLATLNALKNNEDLYIYVAVEDNLIVATACCHICKELPTFDDNGAYGYVCNVYTVPQYRRRGYQQQLLKLLMTDMRKAGCSAFFLDTTMPKAAKLYEKLGFGRRHDYFSIDVE